VVQIHQTVSDADAEVAPAAVEPNPTFDEEEPTTETPTSILTFYRIHKDTEIVVVDQSDGDLDLEAAAASVSEHQPTAVTSPVNRSTVCQWSVTDVVQSIRKSFAGYDKEVNIVADLVVNGLSARAKQNRPKGVILCGPPGTGKSTLAQSLLEALRCNVKYLDHSLLLRVLEGEAETMLRQCFDDAARIPPCCIVMENMELLLPSRSASTTTFLQKRITSCWLSLMDELAAGVVVVGVTSHVNDVDAAARRAGRMEREVEISVPTPADRLSILTHLFQQAGTRIVPTESSTIANASTAESDLESIESYAAEIAEPLVQQTAAAAHGTVGADLLTLVKEIFYQNVITSSTDNDDMAFVTGGMEALSVTTRAVTQITDVAVRSALRKISPSALREVVVEVPTVYWSDIGGMQEVKQALQQVVEWPLKHPDWYASLQIGPLKGVLLYGPPGCSKTLMAKAVATESSMNFLAVRGPELLSKWLGESEKAVQALFRRARAAAPAIIFFDEIDALAGVRGESSSGVSDRVLAQLLTELDGIEALKQVVVIAATNRPDMLDPALIRPGRIDRKVISPLSVHESSPCMSSSYVHVLDLRSSSRRGVQTKHFDHRTWQNAHRRDCDNRR
jgi:SpoVK/Ycf46/Vps4 family AAA+-type ATPase